MDYEGQICRAPMERSSFMLPVMVGCSYNQCKFCNLFRHLKYRELPMEQIEAELKRVRELHGKPKKIFLGDGNAFGLKTEKLYEILDLIAYYFPECEGINMDATVTSILHKSQEELEMLARKKVKHLYLGIESGLDDVLKFMKKDHDLAQAYQAIDRLHEAGLIYDAHIMTGVAGKGRGMENYLEFWVTPEGEVMYRSENEISKVFTIKDHELVDFIIEKLRTRYPQTYQTLAKKYAASQLNKYMYNL